MADYVPSTKVQLMKNVPLDDTYTDTRWFDSAANQHLFFFNKVFKTYTNLTYQRVNNSVAQPRGPLTCRVPDLADNLYGCNYMMFQNENFGEKWFYAFIKQINYINPNNTEIVYEIDAMQTWMFELKIQPSYVLREHASAAEDVAFANLVPEPVGVSTWCEDGGNHYRLDLASLGIAESPQIVMAFIPSDILSTIVAGTGAKYSGIYSGAAYYDFDTAEGCNAALLAISAAGHAQDVVGIWMAPAKPKEGTSATKVAVNTGITINDTTFTTIGGVYTVRNKKLLNSQFTYIKGTSDSGEEYTWKPELCNPAAGPVFNGFVYVCYTPKFGMVFVPGYMGYTGGGKEGVEYSLPFSQQVQCTWNSYAFLGDAIKSALKIAVSVAAAAATAGAANAAMAGGGAAGVSGVGSNFAAPASGPAQPLNIPATIPINPVREMPGMVKTAADYLDVEKVAEMMPGLKPTGKGANVGDEQAFAMGLHGMEFRRMCAPPSELERLDSFFDMFGYAINKVKMPNLDTRTAWNYVKLLKPCIYGSVPVEEMAVIKRAFTNGIRLWHVDAVGNYLIENPAK